MSQSSGGNPEVRLGSDLHGPCGPPAPAGRTVRRDKPEDEVGGRRARGRGPRPPAPPDPGCRGALRYRRRSPAGRRGRSGLRSRRGSCLRPATRSPRPAGQRIEQGRFAGVRRPGEDDDEAFAQAFAPSLGERPAHGVPHPCRAGSRRPPVPSEYRLRPKSRGRPPRRASAWSRVSRQPSTSVPREPSSCRRACRRCASVSASTRSARPSTRLRSMRPLIKARRVNSPASAGRHPSIAAKLRRTAARVASPPWICSSAWSSPVKLFGPGIHATRASSSISPVSGSRRRRSDRRRAPARRRDPFEDAGARGAADPDDAYGSPAEPRSGGEDRVVGAGSHGDDGWGDRMANRSRRTCRRFKACEERGKVALARADAMTSREAIPHRLHGHGITRAIDGNR